MNLLKTELFKKASTLKKQLLQKSDCCVETVTLKKFEEDASPKIKSCPEKVVKYARRVSPFESKKSQIEMVITLFSARISFTLISIHGESHMNTFQGVQNWPRKKSRGTVCVIHSSEIFKVACITNKKLCGFLLLAVNISSLGLVSTLNSIVSLLDPP